MIEFNRLRKEYSELVAVEDLTLVIPPGEVFGLIGPNGAGKTTTLRMACGLLTPTSGSVKISGVDVSLDPELAQSYIGYISDFFSLYDDLRVWEYLDYFAHAYKMREELIAARIDEVIEQVGLDVKHDSFIRGLSRGMKQRLGIARAIVHKPKVLLLDEPASGLDPKARADLRNLLLSLNRDGATIVISSHILSDLEGFCTAIGVMEKGKMVRQGSIETLAAQGSTYRAVRLSWLGEARVEQVLASLPNISNVALRASDGIFRFVGSDEQLAMVLSELSQHFPVLSFGEVKQTVEELYQKLSHDEVM
jgi:ABC-2 type transport system ATP-binding protein